MVAKARAALSVLFSPDNKALWYVCFPTSDGISTTATPPSSSTYKVESFAALTTAEKSLMITGKQQLENAIHKLFVGDGSSVLHNASFWWDFIRALQFELAAGLVVHPGIKRSEAEVSSQLLKPLLRRIAHSAQTIVAPDSFYTSTRIVCSSLNVEVNTEEREGRPGRRPQVDFTMTAYASTSDGVPESEALYCIPVEAKQRLVRKHMAQLGQYQASLSTGHFMREKVSVGFLLDATTVRFSFSLFASDGVPLPVTFISPVLPWRRNQIVHEGTCVALCLIQKLMMPRVTFDFPQDSPSDEQTTTLFAHESVIRAVAAELQTQHFEVKQVGSQPRSQVHELAVRLETLEEEVKQLKAQRSASTPVTPEKLHVDDCELPGRKRVRVAREK